MKITSYNLYMTNKWPELLFVVDKINRNRTEGSTSHSALTIEYGCFFWVQSDTCSQQESESTNELGEIGGNFMATVHGEGDDFPVSLGILVYWYAVYPMDSEANTYGIIWGVNEQCSIYIDWVFLFCSFLWRLVGFKWFDRQNSREWHIANGGDFRITFSWLNRN